MLQLALSVRGWLNVLGGNCGKQIGIIHHSYSDQCFSSVIFDLTITQEPCILSPPPTWNRCHARCDENSSLILQLHKKQNKTKQCNVAHIRTSELVSTFISALVPLISIPTVPPNGLISAVAKLTARSEAISELCSTYSTWSLWEGECNRDCDASCFLFFSFSFSPNFISF